MKTPIKKLSIKLYEEKEVQALDKLIEHYDGNVNKAVRDAILFTSAHHDLIEVFLR